MADKNNKQNKTITKIEIMKIITTTKIIINS